MTFRYTTIIVLINKKKCPYLSFSSMTTFGTFIAVVIFRCCIFFIIFNFLITSQITGTTNEGFEATHNWLACARDVDRVNSSTQLLYTTDGLCRGGPKNFRKNAPKRQLFGLTSSPDGILERTLGIWPLSTVEWCI